MKKTVVFVTASVLMICSCASWKRKVSVTQSQYALKTIDSKQLDQSIDLSAFSNPNKRSGQDSSRVVIYCASGGGSRAAAFNTGIMLELESIVAEINGSTSKSNALNEIDYFSTTSGGSWGVSSYIAYLYQKQKYSHPDYVKAIKLYNESLKDPGPFDSIKEYPTFNDYELYLQNRVSFRYFKYQPKYIIFRQTSQKSTRIITNRINAGYLGWSYRARVESELWPLMHDIKKYPFYDYYVDEICMGDIFKPKHIQTQLPIQIANTTNIDDYKLVPFSPDVLRNYGVKDYVHYLEKKPIRLSDTGYFAFDSIPFASGVHASSGIPFAIGATTFKVEKNTGKGTAQYYLHLQDGGIVEQQAMHSAKAILRSYNHIKDRTKRIVIIVDASAEGLHSTRKSSFRNAGRWYNGLRMVNPMVAPNIQYPITRERIKLLEDEYNCTVIYLGTELLLSDSIGNQTTTNTNLKIKRKRLEDTFEKIYDTLKTDKTAFLNVSKDDKKLLYAYIEQYAITSWSSKGGSKGAYLDDKFNGTALAMFLAGRGVVQLKRDEIIKKLK
jgi:hypothetical protein